MAIQEKSLLNTVPGKPEQRSPFPNLGNFRPYTFYTQWFAIFHNNHIYRAHISFQSTDQFDLNNWEQVTINEVRWEDIIGEITDNEIFEQTIGDLNKRIDDETAARDQQITEAIENEATDRQAQIDYLNDELQKTNNVLAGVHTTSLVGDTLTRTLGGVTEIQKSLFALDTVFVAGKTLIFDKYGTVGVYIQDIDSATILVLTKTISPVSELEPTLLGSVELFTELPLTVTDADSLWGRTPRIDDFAHVMTDDNFGGIRVEYYITAIDGDGNIVWGNPVPLNTSDFQAQTGAEDAGKVLTGGDIAGRFGESIPIDLEPTENSKNLINSNAVYTVISDLLNEINDLKNIVSEQFNHEHPLGSTFEQRPWDTGPQSRGWGTEYETKPDFTSLPSGNKVWYNANKMAYSYGLSKNPVSAGFIADWKLHRHGIWALTTDNIVAGGDQSDGISTGKKYPKPADFICIKREWLHKDENGKAIWHDDDLAEGYLITEGEYAEYYIWQVIVPAGLFICPDDTGYEGATFNRPFISGGAKGDAIRNITGSTQNYRRLAGDGVGAFTSEIIWGGTDGNSSNHNQGREHFNAAKVVPTAKRNVPEHATSKVWKLIYIA